MTIETDGQPEKLRITDRIVTWALKEMMRRAELGAIGAQLLDLHQRERGSRA